MSERRPIIVGNWKLNKTVGEALELATAIRDALGGLPSALEVGVAPPFTALSAVAKRLEGSRVFVAAQNCYAVDSGAFTGEVSAPLLRDVGCQAVIVGHSERRQYFAEDDALISRKVQAVLTSGLMPILCVGELLQQREAGQTNHVVEAQLRGGLSSTSAEQMTKVVVAYEPVWAIGTGKVATTVQAQEVHAFIRGRLSEMFGRDVAQAVRIQYGGSVKADNVAGLMAQPDIDGALVGGASLDAKGFLALLRYHAQPHVHTS